MAGHVVRQRVRRAQQVGRRQAEVRGRLSLRALLLEPDLERLMCVCKTSMLRRS
jgi:hypothetical protein